MFLTNKAHDRKTKAYGRVILFIPGTGAEEKDFQTLMLMLYRRATEMEPILENCWVGLHTVRAISLSQTKESLSVVSEMEISTDISTQYFRMDPATLGTTVTV